MGKETIGNILVILLVAIIIIGAVIFMGFAYESLVKDLAIAQSHNEVLYGELNKVNDSYHSLLSDYEFADGQIKSLEHSIWHYEGQAEQLREDKDCLWQKLEDAELINQVSFSTTIEYIEIPVSLTDWESLDELKSFLADDTTDSIVFLKANADGVVELNGQCEDTAIQLMDHAAGVGKRLSFIPISPDEYYKWYGERVTNYHAICGAIIDQSLYYIEPNTDRCWEAIRFD